MISLLSNEPKPSSSLPLNESKDEEQDHEQEETTYPDTVKAQKESSVLHLAYRVLQIKWQRVRSM